jgi:BASS family bile acid:Na+ symporter
MTAAVITNWLVTIALIELMLVMGLTVTCDELINVLKNSGLITRSLLVNYACVPAITIVLLRVFDAAPEVAVGFLIFAVCPSAPCAPPLTAIAKGNVPVAVRLMLV